MFDIMECFGISVDFQSNPKELNLHRLAGPFELHRV